MDYKEALKIDIRLWLKIGNAARANYVRYDNVRQVVTVTLPEAEADKQEGIIAALGAIGATAVVPHNDNGTIILTVDRNHGAALVAANMKSHGINFPGSGLDTVRGKEEKTG